MGLVCTLAECTVAHTGKCLKSHSPVETCPNLSSEQGVSPSVVATQAPSLATTRTVYPGHELGIDQAEAIMSARYSHLIGVLGEVGTGKTCMLCSLYLLASCGQLAPQHRFAGSHTLPGYESRLRDYRKWPGPLLPDRITPHTELAHPRTPGFLHLALTASPEAPHVYDLLFTDLPGEWTSDLIKSARWAERLLFLRRADGLVLTFRANQIADKDTRHSQIQSARILLQRLRDSVGLVRDVPVVIGVTRCDLSGGTLPAAAYEIAATAQNLGFGNVATIAIASFSADPKVPSGLGLGDVLRALLTTSTQSLSLTSRTRGVRQFDIYQHQVAGS